MLRIGFGFDTHRLETGRDFWLGGIRIPYSRGATGHSDADALIHAICDAMLGAAGLRDIGYYFPDTDAAFKDIDSKILLKKTLDLIKKQSFSIQNIDSTIVLQNPKISSFIPQMITALAGILDIPENCLSIKAKTGEKIGFIGNEEGLSAYAVVLLAGL
jgi:2-C-methyl-D-erythritol 2,4-cyclodiphosphate synthase